MNKWYLKYKKQNKLIEKNFVGYVISFSQGMSFPDGNILYLLIWMFVCKMHE